MRHLKTTLAVLGAVTVLVLAGNTIAMAATGKSFILGKINSANKQTTLTRTTNGPVLKLNAKQATGAPLAVRGTGKVAGLNADQVDGLDSALLLNRTQMFETAVNVPTGTGFMFETPTIPAGNYLTSLSGWINGPTTGNANDVVECFVRVDDPDRALEDASAINGAGIYTVGVSGVLRVTASQQLFFGCVGPTGEYTTFNQNLFQLTLTRIGQLSVTTPAATP